MNKAQELLKILEASGPKTFKFKLVRNEVVARQQESECLVEISIDHDKVEQTAKKLFSLKDVDDNGALIPYETIHKHTIENAEEEMSRVRNYRDAVNFNQSTLKFGLEKSSYLKMRVLSNGKEITSADYATYQLSNTEVDFVKEPTYLIEDNI